MIDRLFKLCSVVCLIVKDFFVFFGWLFKGSGFWRVWLVKVLEVKNVLYVFENWIWLLFLFVKGFILMIKLVFLINCGLCFMRIMVFFLFFKLSNVWLICLMFFGCKLVFGLFKIYIILFKVLFIYLVILICCVLLLESVLVVCFNVR